MAEPGYFCETVNGRALQAGLFFFLCNSVEIYGDLLLEILRYACGSSVSAETSVRRRITMAFTLPPLPYSYDALVPHISAETLHFHHDKHHAGYVAKLNGKWLPIDALCYCLPSRKVGLSCCVARVVFDKLVCIRWDTSHICGVVPCKI